MSTYLKKFLIFVPQAQLTCKEIGDGNINYVFRIMDEKQESQLLLNTLIFMRSSGQLLSTDHSRIEYDILMLEGKYAPEQVPKVYKYDRSCVALLWKI